VTCLCYGPCIGGGGRCPLLPTDEIARLRTENERLARELAEARRVAMSREAAASEYRAAYEQAAAERDTAIKSRALMHRRAQAAESRAIKAECQAEVQRKRADSEMAERHKREADARGVAILHLVYSMREHALRGRIANQRAELHRLNKYIDGVRRDGAYTHQGRAAVAALREIAGMVGGDTVWLFGCSDPETSTARPVVDLVRERIKTAESDYYAIAEALGIMHEGDGCASAPGPLDAVLRAIESGNAARSREGDRMLAEYEARAVRRPVPTEAMEPREGGARQMGACPLHGVIHVDATCDGMDDGALDDDGGPEPCTDCHYESCVCDPLAETVEAVRAALACQPGHELEAIAALVAARETAEGERDYFSAYAGDLAAVDRALDSIDAPHHPEDGVSLSTVRIRELGGVLHGLRSERDAAIARAEKAESVVAKVHAELLQAYRRGAIPQEHVRGAMDIIDKERS
jgi:hypothetical protein